MREDVRGNAIDVFMPLQRTAAFTMWRQARRALRRHQDARDPAPRLGDAEFCAYAAVAVATQYMVFVEEVQARIANARIIRTEEDQGDPPSPAFAAKLRRYRLLMAQRREQVKEAEVWAREDLAALSQRYAETAEPEVIVAAWKEATDLLRELFLIRGEEEGGPG